MTRTITISLLVLTACGENRTIPPKEAYVAPTVAPLECIPNLDGRIEANELKAAIGIPVRYLASPPGTARPVALPGETNSAGQRVWDLSNDYADDRVATLSASAVAAHWFAPSFPNGEFVAALDLGGTTLGVYRNDGSDLLLLGYASREEAPTLGKTLVVYTQPVAIFRFPLENGKQWISVGQVTNATVRGLPFAGRDTYQVRVDGVGQLELPDVTFTQALRVRTTTTIEPAIGTSIVRRQVGWVFECFGEVARATAPDGEMNDDFTTTAELRRLGL
ncbi:MAG: hypothetical protein Q8L48_16370 [Archangium sp.]|nr:hypothetical protein [Archangium sp.]